MKKIQSKMKALVIIRVFRRSRADNSVVSGGNWPKFELIQAFKHVIVTCMKDPIKIEVARVATTFLPL